MSIDFRNPITPDGRPKMLLSIMTRDLNTAQSIWAEATEADLGDLKLYWDTQNKEEDAIAKAAWQKAKKVGHAFYQLDKPGAKEGKQILEWEDVDRNLQAAGSRVQSAPPVRGGEEVEESEDEEEEDEDEDEKDSAD